MAPQILTALRLHSLLRYESDTGVFTWRIRSNSRAAKDQRAGCLCKALGYVLIGIDGKMYYAHRLAWLYVHGKWPGQVIDHINRVRNDNRICNLRDVSRAVNNANKRPIL